MAVFLSACASEPPELPYPAFINSDELDDVFMAGLPGIRAKQFAGDPLARTTSNRIDLPPGWSGTTGGSPGKALEVFVISGRMTIADIELEPGGYAYVPPGALGFNLVSDGGARILYFLDNVDPLAMIQSPIILNAGLLTWEPTDNAGVAVKELRADPGNGARTWMMRIDPTASIPWQASSAIREGFLLEGQYLHSECFGGEAVTDQYGPGGYYYRPPDIIHGGPESKALVPSVWFLREKTASSERSVSGCN